MLAWVNIQSINKKLSNQLFVYTRFDRLVEGYSLNVISPLLKMVIHYKIATIRDRDENSVLICCILSS